MELRYVARADAREGTPPRLTGEDGRLALNLATPRELGGSGGDGASAEALLAAGYAACLLSALRYEAARKGTDLNGAEVSCLAEVSGQDGNFQVRFSLEVSLPSLSGDEAQALLNGALGAWPFGSTHDQEHPAVRLRPESGNGDTETLREVRQEATAGGGYGG